MKIAPLLALIVLTAPAVAQNAPKVTQAPTTKAVRVQITYMVVEPPAAAMNHTAGSSDGFPPAIGKGHRDDLKTMQDGLRLKKAQFTLIATPGPIVTTAVGVKASLQIGTAVGSPIAIGTDGKPIDSHIAGGRTHTVTATPHRGKDGTLIVTITLRDTAYSMDDRTGRHVHDTTPRVVTKTLTFRPGDTLLVTPPVPGTAGNDFAFATVTVPPKGKG